MNISSDWNDYESKSKPSIDSEKSDWEDTEQVLEKKFLQGWCGVQMYGPVGETLSWQHTHRPTCHIDLFNRMPVKMLTNPNVKRRNY